MTKSLIKNLALVFILAAALLIAYLAGSGNLLQGYLNFPRPIFESCKINSELVIDREIDCNNFDEERINLPDGEYILEATYVNKQLANEGKTIIPLKIIGGETICTFLENDYSPYILISDVTNSVSAIETITSAKQINLGTVEKLIKINFLKDGQISTFDQHICGNGIEGQIFQENNLLGTVKLNKNGFLNTTNTVNEIRLNPASLHYDNGLKPTQPGQHFLSLNAYPDLKFQFDVACSASPETTNMSDQSIQTTDENLVINLAGLSTNFFQKCSDKLYLSLQNESNYQNNYLLNNLTRFTEEGQNYLQLKLSDLPFLENPNTVFPYQAIVKLHLRERSDSIEIKTLGEFKLTINRKVSNKSISQNSSTIKDQATFSLNLGQTNLLQIIENEGFSKETDTEQNLNTETPEQNSVQSANKVRRVEFLNNNIAPDKPNPSATEPEKPISSEEITTESQATTTGPEKPLSSQKNTANNPSNLIELQ
ncbi:MAG: hypothetical protein ACRCZE_00205 [Candidatus Altimarinota bacterium]